MEKDKAHKKCSINGCNSKTSKEITLFKMPKSQDVQEKWLRVLGIQEMTKKVYVCSRHFSPEDFSGGLFRRRLKVGSVPNINLTKSDLCPRNLESEKPVIISCEIILPAHSTESNENSTEVDNEGTDSDSDDSHHVAGKNAMKSQISRNLHITDTSMNLEDEETLELKEEFELVKFDHDYTSMNLEDEETLELKEEFELVESDLVDRPIDMCQSDEDESMIDLDFSMFDGDNENNNSATTSTKCECGESKTKENSLIKEICAQFTVMDMIKNDNDIHKLTNLQSITEFQTLEEVLVNSSTFLTLSKLVSSKVSDALLIVLIKLKHNCDFTFLSVLFRMASSSVSKIFFELLPVLDSVLSPLVSFPSFSETLANMPKYFIGGMEDTFIVLDCFEIQIQVPKCLHCKIISYSRYKGRNTVKYKVGVSPAGLIIYISDGFGGKASDKHIFLEEKILEQIKMNDYGIMVDKGYSITEECNKAGVKVYIPVKKTRTKFSKEDAILTRNISSARVHVERTIGRLRNYAILRQPVKTTMFSSIDAITRVCCALVNLQTPVLADDKFVEGSVEV